MDNGDVSQEVKDKLALNKSKVRVVCTYGAGILFAILVLWGTMWLTDRSIAMIGITTCSNLVVFWFVKRQSDKEQTK